LAKAIHLPSGDQCARSRSAQSSCCCPLQSPQVVALLRLKLNEEVAEAEMREYCRANISRQKVPKYFRFVTAFPMTGSGKVKKFELKGQLIKELGLEEVAKLKMA
jgi:fatty-acyl-CoA synthase